LCQDWATVVVPFASLPGSDSSPIVGSYVSYIHTLRLRIAHSRFPTGVSHAKQKVAEEKHRTSGVHVTSMHFNAGEVFARHTHVDGQFAFAVTGGISMFTDNGNWIVPAQTAIWVPANIAHEMHMHGTVTIFNTYIGPDATRVAALPAHCQAFGVSGLLRHLFDAMVAVSPGAHGRRQRIEALLLDELSCMPRLPLSVPLPQEPRLARACRKFLDCPNQAILIDQMARTANMSRRTFTRTFRDALGVSFSVWKQQVCILVALSRLGAGASAKDVALDLGYSSTSAFSLAFRQLLGESPMRYLARYLQMTTVSPATDADAKPLF
jgi:AraC-like DNA-binding protein/quercetin dioxygenase-like cupin family protein